MTCILFPLNSAVLDLSVYTNTCTLIVEDYIVLLWASFQASGCMYYIILIYAFCIYVYTLYYICIILFNGCESLRIGAVDNMRDSIRERIIWEKGLWRMRLKERSRNQLRDGLGGRRWLVVSKLMLVIEILRGWCDLEQVVWDGN